MSDSSARAIVPRSRLPLGGRRDLVLIWIGQIASGFGDSLAAIGFIFLALELTGSEQGVGTFQMVAYIPIALFGLAAGVYVDRRDRRRVMMVADAVRAVALASLSIAALAGVLDIYYAGAVVVVATTLTTFFNPAYNSSLPLLVDDPRELFGVNAVMQSSRQFAAIAGPVFAAFGVGASGPVRLLSLNAVTYVVSFTAVALITTSLRSSDAGRRIRLSELQREARLGLRTVMRQPNVRALFLVTLVDNLFLMGPALVCTVLLVRDAFGGTLGDFAMVELMYAVAMTVTAMVLRRIRPVRRLGTLWAIGLILDGFTFLLYIPATSLLLLEVATFIHALAIPLIIVPRVTIVQRLVPQELLGRAFGYIDIAVYGVTAISAGVAGLVAASVGPLWTIVGGGVLAGVTGLVALSLPDVHRTIVESG